MEQYIIEFFTVFLGVLSAFALSNWADRKKNKTASTKILTEIANGLEKDEEDFIININGHKKGINAVQYFRKIINGNDVSKETFLDNYIILTRDFISIYNDSGYTSLKSKGLELIKNDSIRKRIISLYEYDYDTLRKLEEEYAAMQFYKNYFSKINDMLVSHFTFDGDGKLIGINTPIQLSHSDKTRFLTYLNNIQYNREFILNYYDKVLIIARKLKDDIQHHLK